MISEDDFKALRRRYLRELGHDGIIHFAKDLFGLILDPWQQELTRDYLRGERKVAVRSGHGVGKGLIVSVLVWAQLLLKYPQKTLVTAPGKSQADDALAAEIIKTGDRLDPTLRAMFEWQPGKAKIVNVAKPETSFMSFRTVRQETPEAIAGVHSEDVQIFADEAAAIHDKVFENLLGSLNGPNRRMYLTGNPTRLNGFFYRAHSGASRGWKTHWVCGDKSYPGAEFYGRTTETYRQDIIDEYGRQSNEYRVRVLGEFANAAENAVLPWELLEQARENFGTITAPIGHNPEIWGLDVSRGEGDVNALVRRRGRLVLPCIMTWHDRDVMKTVGRVKRLYDDAKHKPDLVLVDDIGVGGGVTDRLRELGLPIRGVNVSSKLVTDERFATRKTELWFMVRDWLQSGDVALPTHCECGAESCKTRGQDHASQLANELSWPEAIPSDSTGKLLVEPKASLKKRGLKSPNLADALVLTFAANVAIISSGRRGGGAFGRPIRRSLAVV